MGGGREAKRRCKLLSRARLADVLAVCALGRGVDVGVDVDKDGDAGVLAVVCVVFGGGDEIGDERTNVVPLHAGGEVVVVGDDEVVLFGVVTNLREGRV